MKGGTKACDACRIRKIGCERADSAARCEPCLRAEIDCTFTHVRQKPGPAPGYRRKMKLKERVDPYPGQSVGDQVSHLRLLKPASPHSGSPALNSTYLEHPSQPHPQAQYTNNHYGSSEHHPRPSQGTHVSPHAPHETYQTTPPQPPYVEPGPSPPMVYLMRGSDGLRSHSGPTNAPGPMSTQSDLSGLGTSSDSTNAFDRVIPRDLLNHLIIVYFEYMFWLNPYPHRPTLERDVASHREEEPRQEGFVAMVFCVLGMVCLLPKHLSPLSPDQTSTLMAICQEQIMSYLAKSEYATFTHQRLFAIHCGAGHTAKCRELLGSSLFLALQLNLDREATYATFEPLEAEMWRRVWWLVYANDRSGATCEGARPILNEALCQDVRLPSCLDDEHLELAAQGRGSWDADPTIQSPMWGFYYSSAMWRVAGKVLTMRERDAAILPKPTEILGRVAELDMVIEELDDLFFDCPPWLALNLDHEIVSPDSPLGDPNTPAHLSPIKQGIGVQQSNLWITQLAIRLVAVNTARSWWTCADPNNPDVVTRRSGFREVKLRQNEETFRKDRDHILTALLRILQALPIHQIACNAFPGLQKIRYMASTLLSDFDGSSAPSGDADEARRRSFKALTYLQEYINYLARLEAMYVERAKGDANM